jgi:hypothetical protein
MVWIPAIPVFGRGNSSLAEVFPNLLSSTSRGRGESMCAQHDRVRRAAEMENMSCLQYRKSASHMTRSWRFSLPGTRARPGTRSLPTGGIPADSDSFFGIWEIPRSQFLKQRLEDNWSPNVMPSGPCAGYHAVE